MPFKLASYTTTASNISTRPITPVLLYYCVQGAGVGLHPLVPEPGPGLPAAVQRGALQDPAHTHLHHHLQHGQRLDQVWQVDSQPDTQYKIYVWRIILWIRFTFWVYYRFYRGLYPVLKI